MPFCFSIVNDMDVRHKSVTKEGGGLNSKKVRYVIYERSQTDEYFPITPMITGSQDSFFSVVGESFS